MVSIHDARCKTRNTMQNTPKKRKKKHGQGLKMAIDVFINHRCGAKGESPEKGQYGRALGETHGSAKGTADACAETK